MRHFNLFVATGSALKAPVKGTFPLKVGETRIEARLEGKQARTMEKRIRENDKVTLSGEVSSKGEGRHVVLVDRIQVVGEPAKLDLSAEKSK